VLIRRALECSNNWSVEGISQPRASNTKVMLSMGFGNKGLGFVYSSAALYFVPSMVSGVEREQWSWPIPCIALPPPLLVVKTMGGGSENRGAYCLYRWLKSRTGSQRSQKSHKRDGPAVLGVASRRGEGIGFSVDTKLH
jgi:hypothetical protein